MLTNNPNQCLTRHTLFLRGTNTVFHHLEIVSCAFPVLFTSLTPERHAYTRNRIKRSEATDWLSRTSSIPQGQLSIAHLRETSSCDPVVLAHPDYSAILCATMSCHCVCCIFLSHIPESKFLVAGSRNKLSSVGAP